MKVHIEIKNSTVNEWGCVPETKKAEEDQLGQGALDKFDHAAKNKMRALNNDSTLLNDNFKKLL